MRLSELAGGIGTIETMLGDDPVIGGVTPDSRKVGPGALFCAVTGGSRDGHDYIGMAIERGAAALLASDRTRIPAGIPFLLVDEVRQVMALIAERFHGSPTASRPLFGVTGTNGKTTTTYLLESILRRGGFRPAVLGTISYRFGDEEMDASHTTPESTDLSGYFRMLADRGADSYVMEVSSHALHQHRVDGCRFDVGIFTNLTRDHLDYHGSMEEYLGAKGRLFSTLLAEGRGKGVRAAVINLDDPAAGALISLSAGPVVTYGHSSDAQVTVQELRVTTEGMRGRLVTPVGSFPFESPLVGRYNCSNILAASAAAIAFGIAPGDVVDGIRSCRTVPGRLERIENGRGITVLVDYAHTGDALENVLSTLMDLRTGRIITVFGCGGDRDRGKRPIMGQIAVRYSDLTVVTSDNPRTEDPDAIIEEIRAGIRPTGVREYSATEVEGGVTERGYVVQADRRRAIRAAIGAASPGDIVLIAGKGHEDYQIIGTTRYRFDDREEARNAFRGEES